MTAIAATDAKTGLAFGRVYPWLVVAFLIVLYTSSYIDRQILGLLVKPIRADLNINDTQYGLLAGFAFTLTYTFSAVLLGWLVDNGSRRALIAVGCAVWSVMSAACGMATNFAGLFAARLGVGVGEAPFSPAAYSLITDLFPKERLGRAISLYSLGIPTGSSIALIGGGALIDYFSETSITLPFFGTPKPWQMVFLAIGIPGLLLAILTPLIIREPARQMRADQTIDRPNLAAVFRFMGQHKLFYGGFFTAAGVGSIAFYGFAAWMPTYLMRVHDYSAREAGALLGGSVFWLGIPGMLAAGWIADMLVKRGYADGALRVAAVYVAGAFVCGAMGPIVPVESVSIALIVLMGFFQFTWAGVMTAALQVMTPNRMRGQMSALYLFVSSMLGLGAGPTAMGAATDFVFGRDAAVGQSMALVGTIALFIAFAGIMAARRGFKAD